jgi:hypothetical protein
MFSCVPTQPDSRLNERITVLSSPLGVWKLFRDQVERGSGIGLKLFGFIAESFSRIPQRRRSNCFALSQHPSECFHGCGGLTFIT